MKPVLNRHVLRRVIFQAICNTSEYIREGTPDPIRRLLVEINVQAVMDVLLNKNFRRDALQYIHGEVCQAHCELIGTNNRAIAMIAEDLKNNATLRNR